MREIRIADATLREGTVRAGATLSFKQKVEIAKQLDRLNVDVIEAPAISDVKADTLLLRTVASLLTNSALSCPAGITHEQADTAYSAISAAKKPRLLVSVPVSAIQMEYIAHMKNTQVLEWITDMVGYCAKLCADVEFSAEDATRAEPEFLASAIKAAIAAGARTVNISDSAGIMLPDEYGAFIEKLYADVPEFKEVTLSVQCNNALDMATACVFAAVRAGAGQIKTVVTAGSMPSLKAVMNAIKARGESAGFASGLKTTEINRIVQQVFQISDTTRKATSPFDNGLNGNGHSGMMLDASADMAAVRRAAMTLGYDLGEEDAEKVYESFQRVASHKSVSARELETIIASVAFQAPPTYRLVSYAVNSSNQIAAMAQVVLEKDGKQREGVSIGDGPIDAAFMSIEQILGRHYELDDFQIQAVTEGHEAMGDALVRLRHEGKLFSGRGISTDIIGASIHAYINALNKIMYEQKQREEADAE